MRYSGDIYFFFGTIPAVISSVLQEQYFTAQKVVPFSNHIYDIFVMLFYSTLFQLGMIIIGFGLDFTPWFGYSHNIAEFKDNQVAGLKCIFGFHVPDQYEPNSAMCGNTISWTFFLYHFGYILSTTCQAAINADSATYGWMLVSTVSPLASFFWTSYNKHYNDVLQHIWTILSALCILCGSIIWRFWEKKEYEKNYSVEI